MQRQNRENRLWVRLCLLCLCLAVSSLLIFGVTYGRYRQEFPPVTYQFQADGTGALVLGGVVTQGWVDNGTWPAMPSGWTLSEEKALLEFSVSNGRSASDYTQRDQTATVRLVAGLGISAPENLKVELSYQLGGQSVTLTGQAEQVQAGSLVHQNYGAGWIYRFYDSVGEEMGFVLSGGKLSYENLTVALTGETDPVLCQLQVLGSFTD